jgi:hypothetical protein
MKTKTKPTPKKPKAAGNKTKTAKRESAPKLKKDVSVVKGGMIYCVNHVENSTPFWGGTVCNTSRKSDGSIVRWTCSDCVAKAMPAPAMRRQSAPPVIDETTGEVIKRKRGRPRKSPPKPVVLDESGQVVKRGRGRPKGAKNTKTVEKEKMIQEGLIHVEPKRPRGRPKGSKNKVVKATPVAKKVTKKTTSTRKAK